MPRAAPRPMKTWLARPATGQSGYFQDNQSRSAGLPRSQRHIRRSTIKAAMIDEKM
jgi:hypothetical protein